MSSPAAPAAGCKVAACIPVISQMHLLQLDEQLEPALGARGRGAGWTWAKPGREAPASADLGLYFIVHDPSG